MVGSLATRIVATGTLCVVLVACVGARSLTTSSAEATIDPFAAVVSVDNFNSDITLRLEFATSAPRIGESFVLLLENQTNESILFPNDFGTRVYCYSEESEQWLEIENLVTTMTTADVVLDPKGQGFFWQDFVDVTPDVPNITTTFHMTSTF